MTEAKHTPGPWEVKRAALMTDGAFDFGIIARIDGKPQVIAEAFGRTDTSVWPDTEANARLIAAAPEMREALKKARTEMAALVLDPDNPDFNDACHNPADAECLEVAYVVITAALKSADGETE